MAGESCTGQFLTPVSDRGAPEVLRLVACDHPTLPGFATCKFHTATPEIVAAMSHTCAGPSCPEAPDPKIARVFPPNLDGPRTFWDLWVRGEYNVPVTHCPWCGGRLEAPDAG